MSQRFSLYPDGGRYSISELEGLLGYRHLVSNGFRSTQEKDEVYQCGLAAKVTSRQKELGAQYIDAIESAHIPQVYIRDLGKKVGHGLFAEEEIERESYVGEYTGIVRKNDERYFSPVNNYCYKYPIIDQLGRNYVIDATAGNFTRFINHSRSPNLQPIHVYYGGFFHLIFLSVRKINRGEQLTYDYGKEYWYVRSPPESF